MTSWLFLAWRNAPDCFAVYTYSRQISRKLAGNHSAQTLMVTLAVCVWTPSAHTPMLRLVTGNDGLGDWVKHLWNSGPSGKLLASASILQTSGGTSMALCAHRSVRFAAVNCDTRVVSAESRAWAWGFASSWSPWACSFTNNNNLPFYSVICEVSFARRSEVPTGMMRTAHSPFYIQLRETV